MSVVSLLVNGRQVSTTIEPRAHLADFLRETQNLTGTHLGCEHGVCGACTVLIEGVPARSCITLAVACQHAVVTTVEGLDDDEIASELRAAFSREHGLQCGYCTPGMIVSARDVVLRRQSPTEDEIRVAMSGNLCRCTGYVGIIRAIQLVIADRRARGLDADLQSEIKGLGPVGSGKARAVTPDFSRATLPQLTEAAAAPRRSLLPDAGWNPQSSIDQRFTVSYPAEDVWRFFGQIGEVADCLPGASLANASADGPIEGRFRIKVGPITAEFQGSAVLERDETSHTGRISGSGKDRRSGSATRGLVTYAVKPGDKAGETRVDVTIGYTLTGMLAQFGRSELVKDVTERLINAFVANLEARLAHKAGGGGEAVPLPVGELDAGSLAWSVFSSRVRRFFGRLLGRNV